VPSPDVITSALKERVRWPVSAARQQDCHDEETRRGGRLSLHPPEMSSARRTQYRVSRVLTPRINAPSVTAVTSGVVKHRDISAIHRQLALLAAVSASIRRLGGKPSTALIDELLDERIASRPTSLGLASAGSADGDGDADERDDRTKHGPGRGVAHWTAAHHPDSLQREQ
jgi:hypothetical protein